MWRAVRSGGVAPDPGTPWDGYLRVAAIETLTPTLRRIRLEPLDTDAMIRITAAKGLNAQALDSAATDHGAAKYIADTKVLAEKLNLSGTPAFIIGDKVIEGADTARLKAMIDQMKS